MNPEYFSKLSEVNDALAAEGATSQQLLNQLYSLQVKDTDLNAKIIAAKSRGQNPRPLFLSVSALVVDRANVYTTLASTAARISELFIRQAEIYDAVVQSAEPGKDGV
jgi:hypothetical protein